MRKTVCQSPGRTRPSIVDGQSIVVDAWDQVDGNAARRRLGVYSIGYQVLQPDASPAPGFAAPRQTIVFDRLPNETAASLLFASGSGIREYGNPVSRFLYRATNTFRDGVAAPAVGTRVPCRPGIIFCACTWRISGGNAALRIVMSRSRSAPHIRPR